MDDGVLDRQVLVDELGRIYVVGMNSTDPGSRQEDVLRSFGPEEIRRRPLVGQVQCVDPGVNRLWKPPASKRRTIAEPTRPFEPATYILASCRINHTAIHGNRTSGNHVP